MLDKQQLKYYYGNKNIIPIEVRGKTCINKDYANFRKYTLNDFNTQSNVAILTGTEVFRDAFLLVLDCDINLHSEVGLKVFNELLPVITDTVIVKSGGKHDGFHVHYLTPVPVKSTLLTFNNQKKGFIEVKGIHENGYAEQIMLPPSINLTKYKVIHPVESDFIDFKNVKQLRIEELKQKLKNIKSIINNLII